MTSRLLLRYFSKSDKLDKKKQTIVNDIMISSPTTITPDASLIEALDIMRTHRIGCLPVVNDNQELVGVITEMDFLRISTRLLQRGEK